MILGARRALMVAHPDDESLFFGGLLIRHPGDWTVICCTIPRRDPIRAWKFFRACEILGARGLLRPFEEPEPNAHLSNIDPVDLSGFDTVVTHNAAGEYGNSHHRDVHRIVSESCKGRVLVSGYGAPAAPTLTIALSDEEMERKLTALRCYDHETQIDKQPKWKALVERYGAQFDLAAESYAPA